MAAARRGQGNRVVVAVGGDGTVHEVGSGLVGGAAALGVLPVGSGNDFASMVAVPTGVQWASTFFASAPIRACDAGVAEWTNADGGVGRATFINSLGLGFEGAVAARAEALARLRGPWRYLLAVAIELPGYRAPCMRLDIEGRRFEGRQLLLAIGNGRRAGGGFLLNPRARIDDGWLDICRADDLPLHRLLGILPSVFRGTHGRHAGIHHQRCRQLTLASAAPTAVHLDGEVVTRSAVELVVTIQPGQLRVAG
ncbi:MAG: hypothetical protein EA419_11340 [Wenzhouxiangella sp.]|nr:MAG: hypothetical protein EA419_11340 [Wenzhouxiangella sp.]